MKFVGNVWKEGEEMRGKLELIGAQGAPAGALYFKSFEELKQMLEKEYSK